MLFKETFKACDAPKHIKLSKNIYGGKANKHTKKKNTPKLWMVKWGGTNAGRTLQCDKQGICMVTLRCFQQF